MSLIILPPSINNDGPLQTNLKVWAAQSLYNGKIYQKPLVELIFPNYLNAL